MATVACELHLTFDYYHWTGFYRVVKEDLLLVGPYQGSHGCLSIPFNRGVCGAAARTKTTQLVEDVHAISDHIACSSTTQSEIVVPVLTPEDRLIAVLDVDSDDLAAFNTTDQRFLEELCAKLGRLYVDQQDLTLLPLCSSFFGSITPSCVAASVTSPRAPSGVSASE